MKSLQCGATERNGTERNGTERNGTERNGTERNGTGVEIYVHIDKSSSINPAEIDSRAKIIQNRIAVKGADGSITQATLNSIAEIDKQEPNYSHICLLTGQCYPIKSNEEIFNTIQEGKDYMQYMELPKSHTKFDGGYLSFKSPKLTGFSQKFLGFYVQYLHIKRKKLPNMLNMTPYWASHGGILSRDSIKFLLDFVHNPQNEKMIKGFRWVFAPEEVIFPYILLNSDRKNNVINDHLRAIVFNNKPFISDGMNPGKIEFKPSKKFWFQYKNSPHPKILTIEDYDNLIKCGKLFCRKVDFVQSKTLVKKLDIYRKT